MAWRKDREVLVVRIELESARKSQSARLTRHFTMASERTFILGTTSTWLRRSASCPRDLFLHYSRCAAIRCEPRLHSRSRVRVVRRSRRALRRVVGVGGVGESGRSPAG